MNWNKVLEGWRNHIIPPKDMQEYIKELSNERKAICIMCPYNSTKGKIGLTSTCTLCGCFLVPKSKCLSCNCGIEDYNEKHPESPMELKWAAVTTEEESKEIKSKILEDKANEKES